VSARGQDCCARSRIWSKRRRTTHGREVQRRTQRLRVGDPLDPATRWFADLAWSRDRVASYIELGRRGRTLVCGGEAPARTARARLVPHAGGLRRRDAVDAHRAREIFGRRRGVAVPRRGRGDRARQRLDLRPLGSLWTRDAKRAMRVARAIETGVISVNSSRSVFLEARRWREAQRRRSRTRHRGARVYTSRSRSTSRRRRAERGGNFRQGRADHGARAESTRVGALFASEGARVLIADLDVAAGNATQRRSRRRAASASDPLRRGARRRPRGGGRAASATLVRCTCSSTMPASFRLATVPGRHTDDVSISHRREPQGLLGCKVVSALLRAAAARSSPASFVRCRPPPRRSRTREKGGVLAMTREIAVEYARQAFAPTRCARVPSHATAREFLAEPRRARGASSHSDGTPRRSDRDRRALSFSRRTSRAT